MRRTNRRRRAAIRRRNRNRIIVFSIVMVLSVTGAISLFSKLPFFKKDIAKTENKTYVGGDAQINKSGEKLEENISKEDNEEITKYLNNSESIKNLEKLTKDKKEGFLDKMQRISRAKSQTHIYSSTNDKSDIVTEVPIGDYLESYGSDNGWVKVNYQNLDGYVKEEELEKVEDEKLFKVIDGILIVNKEYGLPEDYNPGVKFEAMQSYELMRDEMKREGLDIKIVSDYRSYEDEEKLFEMNVKEYGREEAEAISAAPGHSEHQTGYAFDFITGGDNAVNDSFDETKEAEWLANNSYKYGFILRYPRGKEESTGFRYESWHFRYVGPELAKKIFEAGLTIEEYYGL
ncbi:MAG: M15 family metallopeptidase [Tissierellia bacterium]|nr:M15 family metallopeptidase [Tissierellia bacterium]